MTDNQTLDVLRSLEKESIQLKERRHALLEKTKRLKRLRDEKQNALATFLTSTGNVQEFVKMCVGIEVVECKDMEIFIRFHPMYMGKAHGSYSLQLHKDQGYWNAVYCDMPLPCMNIPKELESKKVHLISDLWTFILLTWHQVVLYVHRQEQFNEAQRALGSFVKIYPSVDTLKATIDMTVRDKQEESNVNVLAHLTYNPHKVLPEEPSIKISGLSKDGEKAMIMELAALKQYPIKEALMKTFKMDKPEASPTSSSGSREEYHTDQFHHQDKSVSENRTLSPRKCLNGKTRQVRQISAGKVQPLPEGSNVKKKKAHKK